MITFPEFLPMVRVRDHCLLRHHRLLSQAPLWRHSPRSNL